MKKVHVARSQLLTAIDLHFSHADPVSVHTLAGAAQEILESLCVLAGQEPFIQHMRETFPEKSQRELRASINLYKNAFKHADRDDADILIQFDEVTNDSMLLIAVLDYLQLEKRSPVPMQVFQAWFFAVHEDTLHPEYDRTIFRTAFPDVRSMSRIEQKNFCAQEIARWLEDRELAADPRTEPLAL